MSFTHKIIPNLLTKEECDLILNFSLENLNLNTARVVDHNHHESNYDSRKSNVAFYPYYEKFPFMLEKISKLINDNIGVITNDIKNDPMSVRIEMDKLWRKIHERV